jgi:hypothetical protein
MKLLTILIALLFTACGSVDPDDYTPQQSDGCPSSGCEEAPQEEPANKPGPQRQSRLDVGDEPGPVPDLETCPEGKICYGMTKKQVLEILPEPSEVESGDFFDVWTWKDEQGESRICFEEYTFSSNKCGIYFTDGIYDDQYDMKPKWLEL